MTRSSGRTVYQVATGRDLGDDVQIALVLDRARAEIKLRLQANARNIKRYAELRELLRQYCQTTEKLKVDGATPRDVGAVQYGKDYGESGEKSFEHGMVMTCGDYYPRGGKKAAQGDK